MGATDWRAARVGQTAARWRAAWLLLLAGGAIRRFAVETDSLLPRLIDVDGERTILVRGGVANFRSVAVRVTVANVSGRYNRRHAEFGRV